MQNFTGTGFTNDNIKKEDIVKQIKNKEDAIDNMHRLTVLANGYASKKLEAGMYGGFGSRAEDETDSKFDYNKFRQGKAQKALAEQQKSLLGNIDRRQQTVVNPNDGQE